MQPSLIIFIALLLSACSSDRTKNIQYPEGGYEYPRRVGEKDISHYFYPIKDILSTKDSFGFATYSETLFLSFNEPNISLKPSKNPFFRLIYFPGGTSYIALLTLQENTIIVKETLTGYALPYPEDEKLDSLEKEHYQLLERRYPINEYVGESWRKKYLDSLTNLYPQLLDANYYKGLINKMSTFGEEKFTYRTREINLTNEKYLYFVTKINQSGFWKMKPIVEKCIGAVTHSSAITLEAATPYKYNSVTYMDCENDTSSFGKVYKELLQYSKIYQNEKRWHDQQMKEIERQQRQNGS